MRIKSNNRGDAFSSSLIFKSAVRTTPGVKYDLSMYTLINCGSAECNNATQDKISVKIQQGDNENFNEILLINGRSIDNRWNNHYLIIEATSDKVRVRKNFD